MVKIDKVALEKDFTKKPFFPSISCFDKPDCFSIALKYASSSPKV